MLHHDAEYDRALLERDELEPGQIEAIAPTHRDRTDSLSAKPYRVQRRITAEEFLFDDHRLRLARLQRACNLTGIQARIGRGTAFG